MHTNRMLTPGNSEVVSRTEKQMNKPQTKTKTHSKALVSTYKILEVVTFEVAQYQELLVLSWET